MERQILIDIRINVKQSEVTPDTSWDIHKVETYKVINAWAISVHFSHTVIRLELLSFDIIKKQF